MKLVDTPENSAVAPGEVAMRARFSWSKVSDRVVRDLLLAAPEPLLEGINLKDESAEHLRGYVASVYGTPPKATQLDKYKAWAVLRDVWAGKEAKKDQLAALALPVNRGLPVQERLSSMSNVAALREFVRQRDLRRNFKKNLHSEFLKAHKIQQPVRRGGGGPWGSNTSPRSGPILLTGEGAKRSNTMFKHQLEAHTELDRLAAARNPEKKRGLIVLPTGAGKTSTAVDWIVPRLAKNAHVRVLWLAHQHELLEQAADCFWKASLQEPSGFLRRMRVISSYGSPPSTLAERDLAVALITWQSLYSGGDERRRARLETFLSQPCIVVVDEAHHAAAPAYQTLLETITAARDVVVIGLTATPWPRGDGAAQKLSESFPVKIIYKTVEEVHAAGILARPVLHVVDTNESIELTDAELKEAAKADLPPDVLKRLMTRGRTALLVRTWAKSPTAWGKTLVFAATRDYADQIGEAFTNEGVDVKVMHGNSTEFRADVLAWFRTSKKPCVLVSVGMLAEGVDLPDARTAFLARPTTSRILLRQMIGRVLRGPQTGGEATAHVVYLRDHWVNFEDTIEPGELPWLEWDLTDQTDEGEPVLSPLPPVLDDNGVSIAADVLEQVRRMYLLRLNQLPLDPATSHTELVGYYELEDQNVPVMDHQRDGYKQIIDRVQRGNAFHGTAATVVFDDTHPPYPTRRAVDALLNYVRDFGEPPNFVDLSATISPVETARSFHAETAMTDQERDTWLRGKYYASLARLAYETFEHFEEAVDRELRELRYRDRNPGHPRSDPERVRAVDPTTTKIKVNVSAGRALPTLASVTKRMRKHLAGESVLKRLDVADLWLDWTKRPVVTTWAHWSLTTSGKGAGNRFIRVNRALRVSPKHVSDELLTYLVFHELLHDLLAGQGHDTEFRRLEALWPDCNRLDVELDTMGERLQLPGQTVSGRRPTA